MNLTIITRRATWHLHNFKYVYIYNRVVSFSYVDEGSHQILELYYRDYRHPDPIKKISEQIKQGFFIVDFTE